MLSEMASALETGMGLKVEHQRLLIRTLWVLAVTTNMLWVGGLLAFVGLTAPFAKASDVDKLLRAAEVNARISMQNEIRLQVRVYCSASDDDIRNSAMRRIDELRDELWEIAKVRVSDPQCPHVNSATTN